MSNIVLTGMHYAVGKTLSVYLAGLYCGDHAVAADGTVSVAYQSDPDGLLTPAYLVAVDALAFGGPGTMGADNEFAVTLSITVGGIPTNVVVPCVVGFKYTSRGQLLPPTTETHAHTQQGPATADTQRLHQYGLRLNNAIGLYVGSDFVLKASGGTLYPCQFSDDAGTRLSSAAGFSGTIVDTLECDYGMDTMLCWQLTDPYPCTVVSASGFMVTEER